MTEQGEPNPAEEPDSLESRVSAVEEDLARVREQANQAAADAAAARFLASGADRDVSGARAELRAHTRSLNALRETQREMALAQREMARDMLTLGAFEQWVTTEFAAVRSEMAAGFQTVGTGMGHLTTMLETLIERD